MENMIGFCCPACGAVLEQTTNTAVCSNGHSYDVARQGYVHLLPSHKMHSKVPGDSREMVEGRRRFLEAGYYVPFQQELCRLMADCVGDMERPVILDAGCGEGYYTGALKEVMAGAEVFGFDISKLAVKAAAGKYKHVSFAVASCFSIPFGNAACDLLVNVFAPVAEEEFARVIKPGGFFLFAVPGERHLYGMKEILYEEPYENEHRETEYEGFSFVSRTEVRETIWIPDAGTAQDLFAMTPYYWKTGVDGGNRLRETKGFSTEIAFDFLLYQRK